MHRPRMPASARSRVPSGSMLAAVLAARARRRAGGQVQHVRAAVQRGVEHLAEAGAQQAGGTRDRGDPPRFEVSVASQRKCPRQVVDEGPGRLDAAGHGGWGQVQQRGQRRGAVSERVTRVVHPGRQAQLTPIAVVPVCSAGGERVDELGLHGGQRVDGPLHRGDGVLGFVGVSVGQRVGGQLLQCGRQLDRG